MQCTAQKKRFKELLEGKLKHAQETLASLKTSSQKVSLDQSIGRLARMDAMANQQMALANRQTIEITITKIKSALIRLEEETFGFCIECEAPITFKRLEAVPESTHCMDCIQ